MNFSIIEITLIILSTVLVVTVIFRAIRLPVILGYLVVGTLVGPHVLGWLADTQYVKELAEFGVALLMFTIGLEFSLSKLAALRNAVFVLGGLQVLISIIITVIICLLVKMTPVEAIVLGCVVAMSSTAIVVKQLSEQFELKSKHGLTAVGILLFQDLAVIPILVLIASLSGTLEQHPTLTVLWSLFKGLLAIAIIFGLGRWLLRPLFHMIASMRVIELFTLSVLFVAIGSAWLTNSLGLSYALGAFLAGIMLGETEFRHQINIEIRPFRDILLGLFFVSIGMLVNITTWVNTWVWILLLVMGLIIGKTALIIILCRLTRNDLVCAFRTGIVLAQGGEFGFAILTLALANKLLPSDYGQVVLAALLISFALAPILIRYNKQITTFFFTKKVKSTQEKVTQEIKTQASELTQHVLICGYGRVGQNIANFLNKINIPYIGLDLDPEIIHKARLAGDRVAYGNTTHIDNLKAAQLPKAQAVIISFDDLHAAMSIIEQTRHINKKIPIVVRCKDESEFENLTKAGATKVVAEIFEESLSLISQLLQSIHIPQDKITQLLTKARDKNYELLKQIFVGSFAEAISGEVILHEQLRPITLSENARVIGQTLNAIAIPNVEIVMIRRMKKNLQPIENPELKAGDILILYGEPRHLDEAEEQLLAD